MKKLSALFLAVSLTLALNLQVAFGQTDTVQVHVFEREDCVHCQDEKAFLEELQETRADIEVVLHNVYDDEGKAAFNTILEGLNLPKVTPLTIIGNQAIQGFSTAETTGQELVKLMEKAKGGNYDLESFIADPSLLQMGTGGATCESAGELGDCEDAGFSYIVDLPFMEPFDVGEYSVPAISLVLGFVDGFNPCAMWVLVMFLTILAEIGSRKRMIQVAGLFLLAEAVMYYLILNVWMTTWDFVGLDRIVTPIVGIVALTAGSYFLYLFYKDDQSCKVGSLEQKRKTSEKMRKLAEAEMTIATALGILILAFSVNIIEFACSIGIPQTFTKLLDINYFTFIEKQFYNALYILMYMIDDLVVFAAAIYSFEKIGLTTNKYTKASHLIGGVIMVILGLIFLLKPSLLVF